MATKSRDAEAVVLAEAMLRELERRREWGGDGYPPRLRSLGLSAKASATDEEIIKAAAKTAFTKLAVVLEKVGRQPAIHSPVCRKKEKDQVEGLLLARTMLNVLEAEREKGARAYPLTLRRLARLRDAQPAEKRVNKAHEPHRRVLAMAALSWLSGDEIDARLADPLGLPTIGRQAVTPRDDQEVEQVLIALTQLAEVSGQPFLLCIDQVDNLDVDKLKPLARFLHAFLDHAAN